MANLHTLKNPQKSIISIFLFLAAAAFAISPLNMEYRTAGIVVMSYLAFSTGGLPFAYLTALLAPIIGLIGGDNQWLIMLPIILSSLFLAVLGLEYSWRYAAIIISPLLFISPQLIADYLSKKQLFFVQLPWEPADKWIYLQLLTAVGSVLLVIYIDRLRERHASRQKQNS